MDCSVEDCDKPKYAKGVCNKHYTRLLRYGNVETNLQRKHYTCTVDGCDNKHWSKGYCVKHYDSHLPERRKYKKKYYQKNRSHLINESAKWNKENVNRMWKNTMKRFEKYGSVLEIDKEAYRYALMLWSKSVKERDNNACQICGKEKDVISHHLFYKSKYPKLSLSINNGLTLCKKCHKEIHIRRA